MKSLVTVVLAVGLMAWAGCKSEPKPTQATDATTTTTQDGGAMPWLDSSSSEPVQPAPAAATSTTYTIQRGDTLWSIAHRTYGDGKRWQDIVRANPGLDPQKLRVGQQIVLPP